MTMSSVVPSAAPRSKLSRAVDWALYAGVAGLFGCVRAGDLLAVDGGAGTVLVHPAPTEIERLRRIRTEP